MARFFNNKLTISILLSFCIFLPGVYASKPIPEGFAGGDGRSIEQAIVIHYVGDYEKSIDSEYDYISRILGARDVDWDLIDQQLIEKDGRYYDKLTIQIIFSKETFSLYFDITEPYNVLKRRLGQ